MVHSSTARDNFICSQDIYYFIEFTFGGLKILNPKILEAGYHDRCKDGDMSFTCLRWEDYLIPFLEEALIDNNFTSLEGAEPPITYIRAKNHKRYIHLGFVYTSDYFKFSLPEWEPITIKVEATPDQIKKLIDDLKQEFAEFDKARKLQHNLL